MGNFPIVKYIYSIERKFKYIMCEKYEYKCLGCGKVNTCKRFHQYG